MVWCIEHGLHGTTMDDTEGKRKFTGAHDQLTERIIACALRVHSALGSGFVESVYENALALELRNGGFGFEKQRQVRIKYLGETVGVHRLDLMVEDTVIVELKAKDALCDEDIATVVSYLKATGKPVALLLNFGMSELKIKRLINTR